MARNLRWVSLVLGCAATLWAIVFPTLLAISLYRKFPTGPIDISHYLAPVLSDVPPLTRYASLAVALIPAGFTIWAWWSLRNLMFCYAKGEVFGETALRQMRYIATALFCAVIGTILCGTVSNYILFWPDGPGHRIFKITIDSNEFADLFKAAIVYVIALVMSDARRIADENAKFV